MTGEAPLRAVLRGQDGLVREDQLIGLGLSRAAIRRRLLDGVLRDVLPGVYASGLGGLSRRQRLLAAQLYGGPGALLTGAAAATVHGLRYVPEDRFVRVLVPHARQRRPAGFVRIHRTIRAEPEPCRICPFDLCSAARSVADAARWSGDLGAVRAMVSEAVRRGITTPASIQRELDSGPRQHSALLRLVLAEVAAGVCSAPEAELRELLAASAVLPRIRWNPRLATLTGRPLPTPDGWIEEAALAIEVDSREYHILPEQWARTLARHNELAAYGVQVLHFTPVRIRRSPAEVMRTVELAYVNRLRAGVAATARALPEPAGVP
ncbi:hypothetical protein [Rhizomonospora bruguierae]|uniref:hypothetical protein n=1 Tax=Rhizomonospora bruguierae TaxID=1581705 RepID=UPI001BCFD044|nr:hypothetical protein [Micromonospora sp. NBRC 107566]